VCTSVLLFVRGDGTANDASLDVHTFRNEFDESYAAPAAVLTAEPYEYTSETQLPEEWNWANPGGHGRSYVTKMLNQHIPQYCGSCWAHGSLSSLADRVKIARAAQGDEGNGPEINLAIQTMLNCGKSIAGTCHGGHPAGAFQYVMNHGIPYDTCQPYEAHDNKGCTGEDVCKDCMSFGSSNCWAVKKVPTTQTLDAYTLPINGYPFLNISEHGMVTGEKEMMAEVLRRGPIACGINAIPLLSYTDGVVGSSDNSIDHVVSITGWGSDTDGTGYWHVRNSWGEYWGERGWAKVKRGVESMGLEEGCFWAVPSHWGTVAHPLQYDAATTKDFYLKAEAGVDSVSTSAKSNVVEALSASSVEDSVVTPEQHGMIMTTVAFGGLILAMVAFHAGRRVERKSHFSDIPEEQ